MQVARSSARAAPASRPAAARRLCVRVNAAVAGKTFHDFTVKDIDGNPTPLNKFKGNVALVVNLASQCGFTPQYTDLQSLYDKYKSRGFTVLGFPCNQFGAQEPGTNGQIKQFAATKYGITFPLFAKVDVNGASADPVWQYMKQEKGGLLGNDIKWNFSKFLVDKEGKIVGRYPSTTTPVQIASDIEKYL